MAGRSDKQPVMGTWDTATTRDNSETLIVDSIMEIINQVVAPEGRSDEWYRRAVAAIDKHVSEGKASDTTCRILLTLCIEYEKVSAYGSSILMASRSVAIGSVRSKASSIEEYLNKPLPPLPPKPYFEYMFADAGSRKDRPEPPSKVFLKPMGNARGETTSRGWRLLLLMLSDHHGVAIPTARMDVITATNNPKQNGALDPYPQQTNVQAGLINAPAAQYPHTITLRTGKFNSTRSSLVLTNLQSTNAAHGILSSPTLPPMVLMALVSICRLVPTKHYLTALDSNIGLLSSKKIRVVEKQGEHDVRSMRAVSVYSNPHDTNSSDHLVENRAVPWGMRPKRTTAALTGYPGQFESYEAGHLRRRGKLVPLDSVSFARPDLTSSSRPQPRQSHSLHLWRSDARQP